MCGRYTLSARPDALAAAFGVDPTGFDLRPRPNITPGQDVAVIANHEVRRLEFFRWGLVPSWAKDESIGRRLINARSETAAEKPSFRAALRRRRCLIVADGFYEWRREGRTRQPFHFHRADGGPFAFAGLWEGWRRPDGSALYSCTILTTSPNELVATVHDRMPVILAPEAFPTWLEPVPLRPEAVTPLLCPIPSDALVADPRGPT